jgi:hypothetical protein
MGWALRLPSPNSPSPGRDSAKRPRARLENEAPRVDGRKTPDHRDWRRDLGMATGSCVELGRVWTSS